MHAVQAGTDWQEVDHRIKRWRTQRETLITELETGVIITHLNLPLEADNAASESIASTRSSLTPYREIRCLCQQMMDYLSAGHFEMYSALLQEGADLGSRARQLIQSIYRHIERSTDEAIAFNDKYDADEKSVSSEPSLPNDVTRLSLSMRQRFDLEDQLITLLHENRESH